MKKLIFLIVFIFWTLSVTLASQPTVGTNMTRQDLHSSTSFRSSGACIDNWSTVYETYHFYVWDTFSMFDAHAWAQSHYAFIYDTASKVIVNDPYYVFHFNNNFKWKSNWKPVGVNAVKFVLYSWYFKTGTLLTDLPNVAWWALVWQVVFNLQRKWYNNEQSWNWSWTIDYYPYPSWPQQTTWFSHYYIWNTMSWYECFNYIVHYCGDGVRDTQASMAALPNWKSNSVANEQCDSWPNNGQPWYCNTSCTGYVPNNPQPYCWDWIINQASEDCDPGTANFWNGCNINCKLMTPSCTFTVNPSQWYVPLTTTISGTTNARWGRIALLYFWDGQSIGNGWDGIEWRNNSNHSFQLSHTYNTTWTFRLTWVVINVYNWQIRTWVVRPTANCTATVQTTTPPPAAPQCNTTYSGQAQYTFLDPTRWITQNTPNLCTIWTLVPWSFSSTWSTGGSRHFYWSCTNWTTIQCEAYQRWCWDWKITNNEACDPNDPSHSGWNNNGYICNNSCQLVNDPNQQPQCWSQYYGQTEYTNTIGYPWINWSTPGLCASWIVVNFTWRWQWFTHTAHYTWSCSLWWNTTWCSVNQRWCWDWKVTNNEACDPHDPNHSWRWVGWCYDNCTPNNNPPVEPPLCNSTYNWTHYTNMSWYQAWINAWTPGLCTEWTVTNFTWRWQWFTHTAHYTWTCSNTIGSTGCQANQNWCWDWIRWNWEQCDPNDPSQSNWWVGGCYDNCTKNNNPQTPTPYFLKQQRVWNTPFTTSDITVHVWDTIQYKLNFGNLWTTPATWKVRDVLPSCLQYLTSSIVWVNSYNFSSMPYWNQWIVMYKDMPLAAWQTWYMLIQAKVKWDWQCANTTTYVNVWHFTLNWTELTGDVVAKRPKPYVKKWQRLSGDAQFVDNLLHVDLWQYIQYKVDFKNNWSVWATGEVKDLLPNCVQYISGSLHLVNGYWPTTGYEWWNMYVKYSNIYLTPWQSGYMLVLWRIKSEDGCQDVSRYVNTWMFHFMNGPWLTSDVVAERDNTTNVLITKEVSPTGPVQSWDIVIYTINYENKWPEVLQSYTIVDYWPNDKLNFMGVVSMNPTASSNYQWTRVWNNIKWTFNTPLPVNGTGQIVIKWQVKQ